MWLCIYVLVHFILIIYVVIHTQIHVILCSYIVYSRLVVHFYHIFCCTLYSVRTVVVVQFTVPISVLDDCTFLRRYLVQSCLNALKWLCPNIVHNRLLVYFILIIYVVTYTRIHIMHDSYLISTIVL